MFQSFEAITGFEHDRGRLATLRAELAQRGLDGFIVPHDDEYQNEYLPASEERLAWLTGFTGSTGLAIVLRERAALFVDGRYTLQAGEQADGEAFELRHLTDDPPPAWLERTLGFGERLGYDPRLHTVDQVHKLEAACASAGARLVACDSNPIDTLWTDRPAPPRGAARLHPEQWSGEAAAIKVDRLRDRLEQQRADAIVITRTDCIAWLFNIRGNDIPHTPIVLARAVVFRASDTPPDLFVDPAKLDAEAREALEGFCRLRRPEELNEALAALKAQDITVRLDPAATPFSIERQLDDGAARIQHGSDPTLLMKACKNTTEIAGARAAHLRDGIALTRFLAWLDREVTSGEVDEIGAAQRLEAFRADTGRLKDISFDTISGAGPNGAIVHYRVTRSTNRVVRGNTFYLVDSGAQYEDGTTDVTRTIAIGRPSDEMRDRYTRVLKGLIALATVRFPAGTTGAQIDSFARRALWDAGLEYDHGTGHGVGSYLSVHEGPARIAKASAVPLEAGMILSNEPGYYKKGHYGIRIENLVLVRNGMMLDDGERPLLSFETLTLAPIDKRPIAPALVTAREAQWLNAYHARVRDTLSPHLDEDTRSWLVEATAPYSV